MQASISECKQEVRFQAKLSFRVIGESPTRKQQLKKY
jgi:hypothetical protein